MHTTDLIVKTNIPYKAVVFDMDGVIFDSEQGVIDCWTEVARKYHLDDIRTYCIAALGITRPEAKQQFIRLYGPDLPYDDYKNEMSALFQERFGQGRLPKKPGIEELLLALKKAGIPTAVASSTRRAVVTAELRDGGLLSMFDKVICGDMVTKSKPDPEIFLTACRELGTAPEETIGIEDSFNGIRAVHAGGLRPIMVPDILQPTEEIAGLAEIVLPSLVEVKQYLGLE